MLPYTKAMASPFQFWELHKNCLICINVHFINTVKILRAQSQRDQRKRAPMSCLREYGLTKMVSTTHKFNIVESIHPFGLILCAEHKYCWSSLLSYWAQSWTGHHSNIEYLNGSIIPASWYSFCQPQKDDRLSQPPLVLIQQPSRIWTQEPGIPWDPKPSTQTIKPTPGI